MTSSKGTMKGTIYFAAFVLLAFVCHAATGSGADDASVTVNAVAVDTSGDDTASIPDFDGDGTIGFGDFVIFAGAFGARLGDEKYDATYDLNGDGEIGFPDFVVFAQNFGKVVPSPAVAIPDANLRAAIEAALEKASGAPITVADMKTLTELPGQGRDISDLTGLEYASNLTDLDLQYNYGITDVSPLSGLTNLKTFTLGCNRFTDLSLLSGLTNLTELNIGGNSFTDISWLSGLTNLTRLELGNNDIRDISSLSGLINLTELGLFGNDLTDVSPLSGLTNLERLELLGNNIRDLSPLAGLIKLNYLDLRNNSIADISPLSGLSNLTSHSFILWLGDNDIRDISPLSGLTGPNFLFLYLENNDILNISPLRGLANLTELHLGGNNIADISPLSGLTNLRDLRLGFNNIRDIPLQAGLTSLTSLTLLDLKFNRIRDISPLSGLTNQAILDLRGNPLSDSSINDHISDLESSGVRVLFDLLRKGDFDIELVFLDHVTERQKEVITYTARRWMSVIVEDLPDYTLTQGFSGTCGGQSYEISPGERIDDLRIYVSTSVGSNIAIGRGWPQLLRETTHLPVAGCMEINVSRTSNLLGIPLHEIGHVLGFGTPWEEFGFLQDLSFSDPSADTHFNGPRAIAAFDDAGGRGYRGKKVPVQRRDGAHWRFGVLNGELMTPARTGEQALSAITVQSLADLGYGVDVTQADPYNTREPYNILSGTTASAKTAATATSVYGVAVAQSEPKLTCGAGIMNEPIYVVDPQGRIVRTISR